MKHRIRAALAPLAIAAAFAGCDDYLTGPGLTENPNSAVSGTKEQYYAGVVSSQTSQQEGLLARLAGMFVQHFSGTGGQHRTLGAYSVSSIDVDTYFSRVYTGGGLIDVRKVETMARDEGDSSFAGIGMFWEAFMVGSASSLWGDLPYTEAVSAVITPALDNQDVVYKGVIAKLDTAIAWIPKTAGNNRGPGIVDLIYGGDRAKYLQAAYTLQARYYMHWVEAQLVGGASLQAAQVACGGDCLAKAKAAAQNGISAVANNFTTYHTAATAESNFWNQFMVKNRIGDVAAGRALVDSLKARRTANGDRRIAAYFDSTSVSGVFDFRGADQNGVGANASPLSAVRVAAGFRQPLITAAENALILAEAEFRLGNAGPALTALNNAKALQAQQLGVTVPAAGALVGTALMNEIKAEEWIASFQNIEAWSVYRRNCFPVLSPAGTATVVPGRLVYGNREEQTNSHIPKVADQPARNRNDPTTCIDPARP